VLEGQKLTKENFTVEGKRSLVKSLKFMLTLYRVQGAAVNWTSFICRGTGTQKKLQMTLNFKMNSARAKQVHEKGTKTFVWRGMKRN